jgi:hypothetical protein
MFREQTRWKRNVRKLPQVTSQSRDDVVTLPPLDSSQLDQSLTVHPGILLLFSQSAVHLDAHYDVSAFLSIHGDKVSD